MERLIVNTQIENCTILENTNLDEVPITQEEYNNILNIQQEILQMIASHGKTSDIFDNLCRLAESLLPNSVASIMLVNEDDGLLSVRSAPSVPQIGHDALANLKPGPHGGSCGNAVYRNDPQFVQDTFHDERWTDLRQIAYDFNLCSCWSMPIRDENKKAIGSFALSSFEHRSPAQFHKKLLETAASIVNIVLKNASNEKRLHMFYIAMESAAEGMVVTNENNQIIEVNRAFEKMYGYKESDVINKNPSCLSSGKHSDKFYADMWKQINNTSNWSGEIINKRADGTEITQWMSVNALDDKENNIRNYFAVFNDLTELKNTQKKMEFMAFHDSLTNLYNKAYLEYILKSGSERTLVLLNINNFSYINTAYGFEIGDKLLIKIAEILDKNFDADNTFRINSDEFALLFNKKIDINELISRIQNYFYNTTVNIDNITLNISFTYGAVYGDANLLRSGALALKQAKESGKNHLHIFNESKDSLDHSHREQFIESNNLLHNALDEDRVVPYFQGIRNNKTKEIKKFEVLVRIEKDGEIISPYRFLEPARLSGLLPEITKVMIDKSFRLMASNDFTFSINITEDDLSRNYLNDFLTKKAAEHKVEPKRVILEILEGISANGKSGHIEQLNELKAKGYSIAIDDFGAEYSNFERVLDLDIDYLKIDAKYIKDIDTNPKSYEIARAIAFFAKNADIPCIAEFVHSESVQKIVDDLGIDFSQGFHFSEPNELPIGKLK